jgi:hypothetical protein
METMLVSRCRGKRTICGGEFKQHAVVGVVKQLMGPALKSWLAASLLFLCRACCGNCCCKLWHHQQGQSQQQLQFKQIKQQIHNNNYNPNKFKQQIQLEGNTIHSPTCVPALACPLSGA